MALINIFALPRSGTAFLTTMLNLHPRCLAMHELYEKSDQHKQIIQDALSKYDYVADVNTIGWMLKDYTPADINICIRRSTQSSLRAVRKVVSGDINEFAYRVCAEKLDKWAIEHGAVIIYYEHLFRMDTLAAIWHHCFEDDVFPAQKVEVLLSLNIQIQSTKNISSEQFIKRLQNEMA